VELLVDYSVMTGVDISIVWSQFTGKHSSERWLLKSA